MKTKIYLLIATALLAAYNFGFGQATIQFSAAVYTADEGAGSVVLSVWRLGDTTSAVTVDFATSDSSATAGLDYVSKIGTVNFAPGVTDLDILVPILNDGADEPALETFMVTLTNPTGGAVLGAPGVAAVRIADNDAGPGFEFGNFSFGSYQVGEAEPFILLAVLRNDDGDFSFSVDFATSDGTAVSGADYVLTNGTLEFAPEQKLAFITVQILNDGLKEANETFRVTLSNPTNQVLGAQRLATVTIMDNDPGVQFVPYSLYRVPENENAITLKVARGNDMVLTPFTVDYATSDNTAVQGLDYVSSNGTLDFAEGELAKTLTVEVLYDDLKESDEQFRVTLSNPTAGVVLGTNPVANVAILDITNTPCHSFEGIAVQPDRTVQLTLGGRTDGHFATYYDLYPIEVSSDLKNWMPLATATRTNVFPFPLKVADLQATSMAQRFYRTATNKLITPWMKPDGPFPVGVVSRMLNDGSRRNRYWISTNCCFMISVWYPAVTETGRLPCAGMDREIAEDPTWMSIYSHGDFTARMPCLVAHAVEDLACETNGAPYPVLVNSPGWTGRRAIVAGMGPSLASHGYVVVSVDHYDSLRTVHPDGTCLKGDIVTPITAAGLKDRVRDLVLILDELARWNTSDARFAGRLDLTRVAAMGGSWGGVTAAEFGRTDPRCNAVIGLDPGAFSSAPDLQQLNKPVLQINASDNGGLDLYSRGTQDGVFFQITSTDHMLVAGADLYWAWAPENVSGGREVARTITAYSLWFLNKYLKDIDNSTVPLTGFSRVVNFRQK